MSSPSPFPVCPRCGSVCGRLARVCSDCGAYLYDDPSDRVQRWAETRRRKQSQNQDCYTTGLSHKNITPEMLAKIEHAAQQREAMHPTGETED